MGRLALTHRGRSKILPPRDLLEPFIERTRNHWYWLAEFHEDVFDRCAEFVWAPLAEVRTRFMVPRLLWQLANPGDESHRLLLENVCGLFTCINPGHWRKRQVGVKIPARIVLPDSVEAMPVVYVENTLNVHIKWMDSESTICTLAAREHRRHGMDKKTVITCDDCISAWVRMKQPFTEVT